jgi:hypothetical protein
MSAVDIAALKEGDTVLVRATFAISPVPVQDAVHVRLAGHGMAMLISPASIVSIEPRPLAVGDRVRMSDGSKEGEILAMYGVIAWVDFGCVAPDTRRISDLVRA